MSTPKDSLYLYVRTRSSNEQATSEIAMIVSNNLKISYNEILDLYVDFIFFYGFKSNF